MENKAEKGYITYDKRRVIVLIKKVFHSVKRTAILVSRVLADQMPGKFIKEVTVTC